MSQSYQSPIQKDQDAQQKMKKEFYSFLHRRVKDGEVIPIIGNSMFHDRLFDLGQLIEVDEAQLPYVNHIRKNPLGWNIEDELALAWAQNVDYPLPEQHWAPRVALYDLVVNSIDEIDSKERYLDWLKGLLLSRAKAELESARGVDSEYDQEVALETIADLENDEDKNSFSDFAAELGYPKTVPGKCDPIALLAKLKFPIYITTSPFDFLERALIAAGKRPRTQICFWSGEPSRVVDLHKTNRGLIPTVEEPLVYHLFGLEAYPETMVLNEDDYLDFLMKISTDDYQDNQLVPLYLRGKIAHSSLLLLGYRLRDWEFRVMFRGLINPAVEKSKFLKLAIQFDPCDKCEQDMADKVRLYLMKYFGDSEFKVEWSTPQEFTARLWQEWRR